MRVRLSQRLPRAGKVLAALSIAVTAVAGSMAIATPAFASSSGDLAAATNSARAAAGLPALQIDGQLSAVAQAWAQQLAASNTLSHNGALRSQVSNWTYLGENVGFAGDVPTVQQAFMNSPDHRSNILNPHYTLMGVGSATSIYPSCGCQVLWVVVDFKRPATAPAPVKAAAPKPAPVKAAPVQPAPVVHRVSPPAPKAAPVTVPVAHHVSSPKAPVTHASTPISGHTTPAQQPTTAISPTPRASAGASVASPSASASASALGTQLAAAAAAPEGTKHDPVSQMLTFATVMSQLPS
ncbi:MAG: CAP domain-containing protein [Acidothermaceae bacterium]